MDVQSYDTAVATLTSTYNIIPIIPEEYLTMFQNPYINEVSIFLSMYLSIFYALALSKVLYSYKNSLSSLTVKPLSSF